MNRTELYQQTIEKWGESAQYNQLIEECAELIAALQHFKRGKIERQAVIDEIADVTLMLGQISWMFGTDQVEQTIEKKITKLNSLLMEDETIEVKEPDQPA